MQKALTQKHVTTFQSLIDEIEPLTHHRPLLIGIDGRPCAGKTTLALKLAAHLSQESEVQVLYLDEFFIPIEKWPKHQQPSFPFFYVHYQEFVDGVTLLAHGKPFRYLSYDGERKTTSSEPTIITPDKIVIVEGVSALHSSLLDFYYKKIWVISDPATEASSLMVRENQDLSLWNTFYLPSVELYCHQKPWERADILYEGRSASINSPYI